MTRVIAITNQKGGVGKTTTAINLCASLASADKRALLVDLDPQGNATIGSGLEMRDLDLGIYEVLLGEGDINDAVVTTEGGYDILPARPALAGAQVEMTKLDQRDFRLDNALKSINDSYDMILLDCPPALNVLTINALTAAREVLIPIQCEYYALEGLTGLMETIALVRQRLNKSLKVLGMVMTMYDSRTALSDEVGEQLKSHFPDKLFRTVIPRNVRLAEAPSYGKSVLQYDRQCTGSQAYIALAGEVIRKNAS